MHEFVQVIAIIVGGVTATCIAVIAWLAGATFKSMKMKERKQSEELNAKLIQMSEGGRDVKTELMKIRADLVDLKELLMSQQKQSITTDQSRDEAVELPPVKAPRELRQQ